MNTKVIIEKFLNIDFSLYRASKKLFALALPMAGSQLINSISVFLCMAMIANLGHTALAASASATERFPIQSNLK